MSETTIPIIKTIPTTYNEVNFRSRLEARWAVYFDCLNIRWCYEFEGFQLPSGNYVPDFFLPNINGGCWLEIKPDSHEYGDRDAPTYPRPVREKFDKAHRLLEELCKATGQPTFLVAGPPFTTYTRFDDFIHIGGKWDNMYTFAICPSCKRIGIVFEGRSERIDKCNPEGHKDCTGDYPCFIRAVARALEYRFW